MLKETTSKHKKTSATQPKPIRNSLKPLGTTSKHIKKFHNITWTYSRPQNTHNDIEMMNHTLIQISMNLKLQTSTTDVETYQITFDCPQILHTSHIWHYRPSPTFRIEIRPRYQKVHSRSKFLKNPTFAISSQIQLRTSKSQSRRDPKSKITQRR